jgi:hypothetical protein
MLESFIDRSYIAIWYWIQEFNPKDVFPNQKKARIIAAFVIDETLIQIGDTNDAWLWVAVVEPIHIEFLELTCQGIGICYCRIISQVIN